MIADINVLPLACECAVRDVMSVLAHTRTLPRQSPIGWQPGEAPLPCRARLMACSGPYPSGSGRGGGI